MTLSGHTLGGKASTAQQMWILSLCGWSEFSRLYGRVMRQHIAEYSVELIVKSILQGNVHFTLQCATKCYNCFDKTVLAIEKVTPKCRVKNISVAFRHK